MLWPGRGRDGHRRAFGEEHAVIGDDPHGIAFDVGEAANDARAVEGLEFVEKAAVDQSGDQRGLGRPEVSSP